eukprot:13007000-Heterocapsa_arctica.AAC.1
MPGKRNRVARSLEISTRTLAVIYTGIGSNELLKIIPEPLLMTSRGYSSPWQTCERAHWRRQSRIGDPSETPAQST